MRQRHPACSRTRDVFDPHHPRSAGSAVDAGPRRGPRLEPTRRDGATAPLAGAVVACVEASQSSVDLAEVLARLPEKVRAAYERFQLCPGCGRVYWEGTHYARLRRLLDLAGQADAAAGGR